MSAKKAELDPLQAHLQTQWIEMAMRQLTNEALGIYTCKPNDFKKVRKAIRNLARELRGKTKSDSAQAAATAVPRSTSSCPPDYAACPGNPRACCPNII